MMRRSRLMSMDGAMMQPRRMKPVSYALTVTMPSPDQVQVDLWKNGKFVRTIMDVDPADISDGDLDEMGRLKPSAVWSTLQEAVQYVEETYGVTPAIPKKADIYSSNYE